MSDVQGAVSGPKLLLADHHCQMEAACRALRATTLADDPAELVRCYRAFEHAMIDHLEAEESLLIPAYAAVAPEDARAIREDHAELRRLLFAIGLEVELHYVRADTVDQLVETMRDAAAREGKTLYPWAERKLPLLERRQLFVRIGHSLRALARSGAMPMAMAV